MFLTCLLNSRSPALKRNSFGILFHCFAAKYLKEFNQFKKNKSPQQFCVSQPDSSQEFIDATKFYGSKYPKNLKRIILEIKRPVSEREIFLEKEGKNTLQLKLN